MQALPLSGEMRYRDETQGAPTFVRSAVLPESVADAGGGMDDDELVDLVHRQIEDRSIESDHRQAVRSKSEKLSAPNRTFGENGMWW